IAYRSACAENLRMARSVRGNSIDEHGQAMPISRWLGRCLLISGSELRALVGPPPVYRNPRVEVPQMRSFCGHFARSLWRCLKNINDLWNCEQGSSLSTRGARPQDEGCQPW